MSWRTTVTAWVLWTRGRWSATLWVLSLRVIRLIVTIVWVVAWHTVLSLVKVISKCSCACPETPSCFVAKIHRPGFYAEEY